MMNRRTALKGGLVLAVTAHAAADAPENPVKEFSVDEFLAKATPNEVIRYHSNALMQVLAEGRPDLAWATLSDIDNGYVYVVGKDRQAA